jgi:hypothetical protein
MVLFLGDHRIFGGFSRHFHATANPPSCALLQDAWLLFLFPLLFLFFAFFFSETGADCVAQAGFKLVIFLPQPPQCWDYRCVPLCLAFGSFLEMHSAWAWDSHFAPY